MFTPEAVGLASETRVGVALVLLHEAISAATKAVSRSTSIGLRARKGTGLTEQAVRFTCWLIIFSFFIVHVLPGRVSGRDEGNHEFVLRIPETVGKGHGFIARFLRDSCAILECLLLAMKSGAFSLLVV